MTSPVPTPREVDKTAVRASLTEEQLDALQWAKEFMERYERKRKKVTSDGSLDNLRSSDSGVADD